MKQELYELTNPQKPIWLTEQYFTDTAINTICGYVFITDKVNLDTLKTAIHELVKSNDGMRLKLKVENDNCMQYVSDFKPFDIDIVELSSKEEIEKKALEMASIPFIQNRDYLFKYLLFKLPDGSGGFIVNVHHLIGDSWSLGLIAKEVTTIYSELLAGTYEEKVSPSYLSYIEAEKDYKSSDKYSKDKAYWEEVFRTIPEVSSLANHTESKKEISCSGNREKFTFSEKDLTNIKAFCDTHKISVYNFFMSVYALYISRVSHLDDFVIGTPILNRTTFEQKHTMGMFISVAPLRVTVKQDLSFLDFTKKIATDTMSLFRHQKYSYQSILEDIRKRDSSIPNLYNVVLSYQITKTIEESNHVPYSTDWVFNGNAGDELQIHLFDLNDEAEMTVAYDYKSDLFNSQDISNLHHRILAMVRQIVANDAILLNEIEIVTAEEKKQILYDFNSTLVDYPRDKTIVDLFEEQVEKTPDAIALIFENQKLTYRELNEKANDIAQKIDCFNQNICILCDKSLEMIIGILAILKSGNCYVPINPQYPDDRVHYILESTHFALLLTTEKYYEKYHHLNPLVLSHIDNLANNINKSVYENNAYIIFTSGTTGKPKGVEVLHKTITNTLLWRKNFYHFDSSINTLQLPSFAFDSSVEDIFTTLISGACLCLPACNINEVSSLIQTVKDKNISHFLITPALYKAFLESDCTSISSLKFITVAGESFNIDLVKRHFEVFPNTRLLNEYGPTENSVCSTVYEFSKASSSISIGKPISNSTAYVVSPTGSILPVGVSGELWVGGSGIVKGYLNNPSLTQEKFIPNPFGNGMIYKTGDLVRWLPDGNLEFIGRIDNQVKIRGFRIELNEIDANILSYPHITHSISVVKEINHIKTLCSYIVAETNIDIKDLKQYLAKTMVNYMVPVHIMQLNKLPLNINGKVDKKQLPMPSLENSSRNLVPCRNDLDEILISMLADLFDFHSISIEDNLFDIGIDSLSAITLSNHLSSQFEKQIAVKDIFDYPIVKDLSDYIDTLSKVENKGTIKRAKKSAYYPASNAQKRIYYASNMDHHSTLYNTAGGIIIDKPLDIEILKNCFEILIDRHEVLRTHFAIVQNDIVQMIDNKIDFDLSVTSDCANNLNSIYADFVKPFDLEKAPLFRAKVVTLDNHKMLLLLDMHHIVSDGTSLNILLQELCALYNGNTLPEKQVDYKDFTLWEKEYLESEEIKHAKDFWVNQFKDEIPLLNMPTTFDRPAVQSFEGANYHINLPKEVFEKVNKVSKNLGVTPYMLMLATYFILLSKYTAKNDIIVGTPIVGRELPELSNMLGMFVNTLALRTKIDYADNFSNFLAMLKEYCLSAFQNQAYPFDELVKDLNIKRETNRNSLVDVMFVYQNNGYPDISLKDVHAEYFIPDNNVSKFDLSLEVIPLDDEFSLRFEYCTKLFDENFIKRLASHYINILSDILENSDIKIADIDMLSQAEKNQILYDFNDTKVDYPRNKTIVDLFEEQVEKTPDNIAVVFEEQKLTYKELNKKANQLARYLVENDISPNDIVCLLLDKSLESIVSILATLKIGATYLPIDISYPNDRIDYIIKDSKAKILLTTKSHIHKSNSTVQAVCIELDNPIYLNHSTENIHCQYILPESLAYVMYTSGSTGNPKGVMVSHRNIVRLIKNNQFIHFNKQERILQTGSIVFDACTFEIFGALLNGFELYIIKKEELLDSFLLQDYLLKNKITILWLTAPLFNQLCEENPHMFSTVRILLTGGDVLSPKHINMVKAANPNLTVINGYGPTENTTFSCCFTIDKKYTKSIPIGKPISNSTAYVVSPTGDLCPIGIPGELWVGGDGVAKGYLNNDKLTSDKFIKNPFEDGILYKTGDFVKWLPNGLIEFIGRIDSQVKIRGFRVELGEITTKIMTYPSMKECVTTVNSIKGEKSICSYIVADKEINIQELKHYLKKNLPIYMVPTYFMQLKKLPINTNGKVDKNALPTTFKTYNKNKAKLPSNDDEQILLDIFKKLLSFDDIGIDDNFFELGGDSLLAIKLQVEATSHNLKLNYADIFEHPTVEELAKYINHDESTFIDTTINYEKYDTILENNRITSNMKISNTPIGNVLLTGFTGFLGAHILDSFMKKEQGSIYCLIRRKNNMSPEERLRNVLHFYFDTKYDEYIGTRIKLVEGDITLKDFGLNVIDYNILGTNVNTVIHSAALVKHYGSYKDFESINIIGTKMVIDFAKLFNLKLLHVSTISVSGNNLAEGSNIDNHFNKDITFDETNFYIGQNLKNFYVRSKFEAEKLVLDAISDGLQACILRMGNLTSRFSEGKFQQNHFENAFVNRIKSFLQIGCIPDYLLHSYCEFTPIDFCGDAIITIANHICKNYTVFHLLNEKHVYLDRLFQMLNELGMNIKLVTEKEFQQIIFTALNDENKKNDLDGIINDLDSNKKFIYKSDVKIDSTFTKQFLSMVGFEWPYIDINYIRNFFKYLIDIGYLNIKMN